MYSFETRVRYSELAEDRSASLVSIINYFQDCCTFESEDGEIGLDWLAEHDTAWMLTGWQIHIIRSPRYCERVKVTTWACGFKYFVGKRSFTITTLEGEVLVYAMSDWAYMNVKKQLPENICNHASIFHLRGGIDYSCLNLKHRTMMALLYRKAKGLPEEKKTAEVRAMIDTYGKRVDFVDLSSLDPIIREIGYEPAK